jgi:glycosyltransferase involved in cell wall biosynthesis
MISVIVCSDSEREVAFSALAANIKNSVGVPFEIIRVVNDATMPGICEAYNRGAAKAKYNFLCFVHDDIFFTTNDWGKKLIKHFDADEDAGLIGVLGCIYKTKMVAWWPHARIENAETKRINIIQHYKYNPAREKEIYSLNPFNEQKAKVVDIDGVFMATKKNIWEANKFDADLFKGFHGYDADFSIQVGRTKNLYVVYDIVIEHFSEGNFDCDCLLDYFKLHKKWKTCLPLLCGDYKIDETYKYAQNLNHLRKHLKMLIRNDFSFFSVQKKFFFLLTFFERNKNARFFSKNVFAEWILINRFFFSYHIKQKKSLTENAA